MSEFEPQSFSDAPLTVEDLNTLASNDQWLFENLPKINYRTSVTRSKGVKVLAGKSRYNPSTRHWAPIDVSFGSFFSAGCNPVVVANVQSEKYGRKYVSVNRIGGAAGDLDHTGFRANICSDDADSMQAGIKNSIESGGWINWIAVGY